jgi:hypothetical protein
MQNEFRCLSNALLRAGLRCDLPVAFSVPPRVRAMVGAADVAKVRTVTLHQCPQRDGTTHYVIEMHTIDGDHKVEEFGHRGKVSEHDTFVLYDRHRDGRLKHLHYVH